MLFSENDVVSARNKFRDVFREKTKIMNIKLSEIDNLFSDVFFRKEIGAAVAASRVIDLRSMPNIFDLKSKSQSKGIDISDDVAKSILFEVLKPIFCQVEPFLIGLTGSNKYCSAEWSVQQRFAKYPDVSALILTSKKITNISVITMCGYEKADYELDRATCDLYCSLYNYYLQNATNEAISLQNKKQFHPTHSSYFSIFNSIKIQCEFSKIFLKIFYEEAQSLCDRSMHDEAKQLSITDFLEDLSEQISINDLQLLVTDCCADAFTDVAKYFCLWQGMGFQYSIYAEHFVEQMILGFVTPQRFCYLFEKSEFDNEPPTAFNFNEYVTQLVIESAAKLKSGLLNPLD